jgi:hypothetical protein
MQRFWLKSCLVMLLLILIVLFSDKGKAWASPSQSPHFQTVPTRVRTKTPTSTSKPSIPTETPTNGLTPSIPTKTQPAISPTPVRPTDTLIKSPTNTPTGTATQPAQAVTVMQPSVTQPVAPPSQIALTHTNPQPTATQLDSTDQSTILTETSALQEGTSVPQSSARSSPNTPALITIGIVLIPIAVLIFILLKKRPPQ